MRPRPLSLVTALAGLALATSAAAAPVATGDNDFGLKRGTVELKSAGPLAFGPNGILLIGDPQGAAVYAVNTGDRTMTSGPAYKMAKVEDRIAGMLGTAGADVAIADVVVNPASGLVYFSVGRGRGPQATPVLLKLNHQGEFSEVPLKDVKCAKATLPDPATPKAGGRPMRSPAITGLAYLDGKVYVAAISNEEFDSTFRAIPFPFADVAKGTTVEIYHGSHGRLETNAPIRTFTPYEIAGTANLLASYTCTPLVKIPVSDLKPGAKIKGTTVAELGNRNTPLDMVVYNKGGKDYLLMINDNRGVMKIDLSQVGTIDGIHARVNGKAGLPYETIDGLKGVVQLSKLDNGHAVTLTKNGGSYTLDTIELP
ncbi:MAG TPA: hypothetical protein VGF55_25295 [Gemmataceae bacterium]|jgi:hypothetical protein